MDVSLVIPTYNRSSLLAATVPALMGQRCEGVSYDVIFVDNGSTDATATVLADFAARYEQRIRFFSIAPTGGPSAPRNVGIRAATGEIVIILDDDVLPDPELVAQHARFHHQHSNPRLAALGEVYVPEHLRDDPMGLFHTFPYHEVRNRATLSYLHFWTCNVSFKRCFMLSAGMFDESFLYYEDVECAHRLAEHGLELRFLPAARGQHLHQLQPAGVPAKGEFTGRWLYAFVQRYPEPEVKRRFGVLSPSIGAAAFLRRVVNRLGFRLLDNPMTRAILRSLGATNGRRSRRSDLLFYMMFRRNMLAGYAAARREHRRTGAGAAARAASTWQDRGERAGRSGTVEGPGGAGRR